VVLVDEELTTEPDTTRNTLLALDTELARR